MTRRKIPAVVNHVTVNHAPKRVQSEKIDKLQREIWLKHHLAVWPQQDQCNPLLIWYLYGHVVKVQSSLPDLSIVTSLCTKLANIFSNKRWQFLMIFLPWDWEWDVRFQQIIHKKNPSQIELRSFLWNETDCQFGMCPAQPNNSTLFHIWIESLLPLPSFLACQAVDCLDWT